MTKSLLIDGANANLDLPPSIHISSSRFKIACISRSLASKNIALHHPVFQVQYPGKMLGKGILRLLITLGMLAAEQNMFWKSLCPNKNGGSVITWKSEAEIPSKLSHVSKASCWPWRKIQLKRRRLANKRTCLERLIASSARTRPLGLRTRRPVGRRFTQTHKKTVCLLDKDGSVLAAGHLGGKKVAGRFCTAAEIQNHRMRQGRRTQGAWFRS